MLLASIGGFGWILRTQLTVSPLQAKENGNELLRARTVLALVAHPDDLEWYVGGTLKRLADSGAQVQVIVASDGERGPNRTGAHDLHATRRAEQVQAAQILGYSEIHFLGLPDRAVAAQPQLLSQVSQIYRDVKPDAVLIFDPVYPAYPYLHADHQGSAQVFLRYWQSLPQKPPLYLFQTRRPNVAVDISGVIDSKVEAMNAHRSQGGGGPLLRRSFAGAGQLVGLPLRGALPQGFLKPVISLECA